jgi:hypothetical protein
VSVCVCVCMCVCVCCSCTQPTNQPTGDTLSDLPSATAVVRLVLWRVFSSGAPATPSLVAGLHAAIMLVLVGVLLGVQVMRGLSLSESTMRMDERASGGWVSEIWCAIEVIMESGIG